MNHCPACGDTRWFPLGRLGRIYHVRCRCCGYDFTVSDDGSWSPTDPDDDREEVEIFDNTRRISATRR